jgi:hypothetical protein
MKNRTNAAIADGLMREAARFATLRTLAVMPQKEQDRILQKMPSPTMITGEVFDNWVDELITVLAKAERKTRRGIVPDEA